MVPGCYRFTIDMLQRRAKIILQMTAIASLSCVARAQVTPEFYSPAGTAFTPEIGVVNTGVLQDVQGIVSSDEKYVTLTMGSTSAGLLALHEFTFQNGAVNPAAGGIGANGLRAAPAPVAVTILDRRGITRVD
jgi:hypothetical protein